MTGATASAGPGLDVELTDLHAPGVPDAWRHLEARHPGLSCSWDWTAAWVAHFGDLARPRVVALRRAGEVRGLALLSHGTGHRHGPVPVRTLHLGCAGEPPGRSVCTPYNRLLAAPEDRPALAAAVLDAARHLRDWDELRLEDLAEADAAAFTALDDGLARSEQPCRTRDLQAARAAGGVQVTLPGKLRYQLRRSVRDLPPLAGEWAASAPRAHELLDELAVLHQAQWQAAGAPGAFADPRFGAFQHDLVDRLADRGGVVVFRLRAGDTTVGCLLGYVEDGRVLMYQGGFGRFEDQRAMPGILTHLHCMEVAAERGLCAYDLLQGDADYKRRICDGAQRMVTLTTTRRTARTTAVAGLRSVRGLLR